MKRTVRLFEIWRTLHAYGISPWLLAKTPLSWLNNISWLLPWLWIKKHPGTPQDNLPQALEALGPIFIKFGQALSTRPDLITPEIAQPLTKLQDKVKPFDSDLAQSIITQELQKPLKDLFKDFNPNPLSAASIAQVHEATLPNGDEVVVKIVRPDIKPIIERDIALLYSLAHWAMKISPIARRLRAVEVVREFDKTLEAETDMMHEAANASIHRRNWLNSPLLYVPWIDWERTSRLVLTQERIHGIPIRDMDALRLAKIDITKLSENGVIIFFTQVFKNNFFHADMHPGNIFVLPDGRYAGVDFGIMGSLPPEDQRYLAENFVAFFQQDYQRVAKLHIESGWVDASTRIDELESAFRSVSEPIFGRPLKEISFGLFLLRLFEVARRFGMVVQPQLVLLQKTLLAVEGLGRQLNGDLDLNATAKPFLENWMKEQLGAKAFLKNAKANLPFWLEKLPQLPDQLHKNAQAQASLMQTLQDTQRQLVTLTQQNQRQKRRQSLAFILVVLAILAPVGLIPETLSWAILALALVLTLKS